MPVCGVGAGTPHQKCGPPRHSDTCAGSAARPGPGGGNFCNGPDLFGDPSEELPRPGGRDRFDPSVAAYVAAELVFGPASAPWPGFVSVLFVICWDPP